ncbi:MAG: hypothetical protein ACRC2B_21660 [Rubrivivax sp.]
MKATLSSRWATLAAAVALGGCAVAPSGPNVMVLPGTQKSPAQFQTDSRACQLQAQAQVAPSVDAANNQAAASAVVGTAIGAAFGALVGYYGGYGGYGYHGGYGHYAQQAAAWGAGTGLLYGGAVGGAGSQAANPGLQQRYDVAYLQCMYSLGHQIPGQSSARQRPPAPPPPPPGYRPPVDAPRMGVLPAVPPPNTPPPIASIAPP